MFPIQNAQLNKNYVKTLIFSLSISILSSCNDGTRDIHNFYFPLKKLKLEPKVYVYNYKTSKGENVFKAYWYYQTIVQGDSIWFVGSLYDSNFTEQLMTREKRFDNGMVLEELKFLGTDSLHKSISKAATITNPASFPFAISKNNGVFVSSMEYGDLSDSLKTTTLTRNRRYLKDTTINFEGKKHDALIFSMEEEQSEKHKKQGDWTHVYSIQEVYAEGIGLFETRRDIVDGTQFIGTLERIISLEDFEKEFKLKNR
jgi:hypothetical protein